MWTVVVGGPPAWGECGSHALRMAEAFWKLGHKVLYIECGGNTKVFRRALGQRKQAGHTVVGDLERRGFFVMRAAQVPLFPVAFPEFVRRWNCSRTSARAAKFLAASDAANVIVCHYSWYYPELFALARETASHVYECTDDHRNAPGVIGRPLIRRRIRRVEKKLLGKADLTTFTSQRLAEARGAPPHSTVLPVGVDTEHFSRPIHNDPHERLGLPERRADRPRIGFVGRLTQRSDWAMVRAAAAETPDWQWMIVGPAEDIRPRGPENLHWLGPVKYDDLPAWLQHWDVGIVPSSPSTEFNERSWPMKLLEYLAAGLPVVSSDIPAAQEVAAQLPGVVKLCSEHTSGRFVETIRAALAVPAWKREAGRSFTRRYSWQARARELLDLLGQP